MDLRFELENSVIICGPSKAGKTSWIYNIIKNKEIIFKDPPKQIYWFYSVWQKRYDDLRREGIIMKADGIDENEVNNIMPHSMVVLDDLVMETENNRALTSLFTKYVHHKSLFLVYVTQNFYHQSKEARMRHLNSHFIVFFKNPRDKTQTTTLARQMFPGRSVKEFTIMFERVTERPYGYLLIDLRQDTPSEIRLRTNIFPHEFPMIVYK